MESLSPDITIEILSRLPVESVLQCKQVCRTWRTLLPLSTNTYFGDMHLHHLLLQPNADPIKYQNHFENQTGSAKVGRVGLLFSICLSKGVFPYGERRYSHLYYYGGDFDEVIKNIDEQLFSSTRLAKRFLQVNHHDKQLFSSTRLAKRFLQVNHHDKQLFSYKKLARVNHHDEQLFSYKKLARVNHHAIKMSHQDAIIGSCNGLVCFNMPHGISDPLYICNPITSEYVNLPRFHHVPAMRGHVASGFGYHTFTKQYKVVRIYYPHCSSVGEVQVYTLGGGNGWRSKGKIKHELTQAPGCLLNGALHWMDYDGLNIVAFDLVDEEFSLLPSSPCFIPNRLDQYYQLVVLGGCLCIVHQDRGQFVDIWFLKMQNNSSYEMEEQECYSRSWSMEFTIPLLRLEPRLGMANEYEPFALTENNEVLLWFNRRILACYDPKTATLKKIWDHGKEFIGCQAIPHMNSFVSLKAIGEKSKRRRYRISRKES